jgi:Pyruvate/2-oxoacid:ferredoxin oxidoreductase gamma subunit
MTEKSLFAGFGGQGIVSLGQLWVYFAMQEGKNVTFFPFNGEKKRVSDYEDYQGNFWTFHILCVYVLPYRR